VRVLPSQPIQPPLFITLAIIIFSAVFEPFEDTFKFPKDPNDKSYVLCVFPSSFLLVVLNDLSRFHTPYVPLTLFDESRTFFKEVALIGPLFSSSFKPAKPFFFFSTKLPSSLRSDILRLAFLPHPPKPVLLS